MSRTALALYLSWFPAPVHGLRRHPAGIPSSPANWAQTLERIANGVVTIQIDSTRAFDTEVEYQRAGDRFRDRCETRLDSDQPARRDAGPVIAQATFLKPRRSPAVSVYRDPVHDFGIYRYDPAKLKFIQPAELPLYPAGAVIGREIRRGRQRCRRAALHPRGHARRLDREAPEYGYGKYNDFNTFYYQAAVGNVRRLVGFPGDRHRRARGRPQCRRRDRRGIQFLFAADGGSARAQIIEAGKPVPRGTLETVFKYTPYDELRRLGLNADTEARMRAAYPKLTACWWSTM